MNNIEKAEKKILNVCKRFNVAVDWNIDFPNYKGKPLPKELKRAIALLGKHEMKVLFTLKDLTPPTKPIIVAKK